MSNDLSFYIRQRSTLREKILDNNAEYTKIQQEIEQLRQARQSLNKIKNRVDLLKKQVLSKNVCGNLRWRGKYKNDFDKILDKEAKRKAEDFSKDLSKMIGEVEYAISSRKRKMDGISNSLNALRKKLSSTQNNINRLWTT